MPLQSLPAELFVEILRALALFERESILIASKTPSQHGDPVSSRTLLDAFLPYMLVSRIWRSEIENTIYSSVRLSGPAKAVLFSRTIVTSPRGLGDIIRHVHIRLQDMDTLWPSRDSAMAITPCIPMMGTGDDGRLLRGFSHLIRAALLAMPNLTSYTLHLGKYNIPTFYQHFYTCENKYAPPFLPVDAPFRLQKFSCKGLAVNALLVGFLRSQPAITELHLPDAATNFILRTNLLPRLETAAGPEPLVRRLMIGRPIKALECTSRLNSLELQRLIATLVKSTASTTGLILPGLTDVTLEDALAMIASSLPSIASLAMSEYFPYDGIRVRTEGLYKIYMSRKFQTIIGSFLRLQELAVPGQHIPQSRFPPRPPPRARELPPPDEDSSSEEEEVVEISEQATSEGDHSEEDEDLDWDDGDLWGGPQRPFPPMTTPDTVDEDMIWDEVIPAKNAGYNGSFVQDLVDDVDTAVSDTIIPITTAASPMSHDEPGTHGAELQDAEEEEEEEEEEGGGVDNNPEPVHVDPQPIPVEPVPPTLAPTTLFGDDPAVFSRANDQHALNWVNHWSERDRLENEYQVEVGPAELEVIRLWETACPTLERVAFKQTRDRYTVWSRSPTSGEWRADCLPADAKSSQWANLKSCQWPGRVEF